MDEDRDGVPPPLTESQRREYREMRLRVPARVLHLNSYGQTAVERAVRVLRAFFVDRRDRAPKQGTLHWLMLVGDYADTNKPVKAFRERPDFEIWAFVDHEAFKGLNRHWGRAREMIDGEVGHMATITLSVFTIAEVDRFRITNAFLARRYATGLILYDQAMDPPRDADAQAIHDRIEAAAEALPQQQRTAFRHYRYRGLDIGSLASALGVGRGEAEMHLSEAFETLITTLKRDAHARSLRPGLGHHPRHNLDLYHCPGDQDRLLAVGRYRSALSFAQTMAEAETMERSVIVVHHAAYAAELALKTVLLRAGRTDDWIRNVIGLDLAAALHEAMTCGLPAQPPEAMRLIVPLAHFHLGGRTPFQARDVLAAMPAPAVVATIGALLDAVGRMTGYRGLPGEDV